MVKSESLVIVNQNVTVNTFPALYTPPVTPWEGLQKKRVFNLGETLTTFVGS